MAAPLEHDELVRSLHRYAGVLHAACLPDHHVVSPLGAWLLLALIAPAADGDDSDALVDVLGVDPDRAAATAAELLGDVHPDVSAAAAVWFNGDLATEALHRWLHVYAEVLASGDIPDQAEADEWTRRGSLGLIEQFPFDLVVIRPDALMATVLATRSIWRTSLGRSASSDLPGGPFAAQVDGFLRADLRDPGHDGWIAGTDQAGDVVVHRAEAGTGLVVWSVCAAADVAPADVLSAAYTVATEPEHPRRRLAELEVGTTDRWTISERVEVLASAEPDPIERLRSATLPAWSATADVDLLGLDDSGFVPATRTLGHLVGLSDPVLAAKQVAVARFHREGFEAAAVTAMMALRGLPIGATERTVRTADLRFPHPYAVVATTEPTHADGNEGAPAAWHHLPVFSAWVTDAEEPGDEEDGNA